MSLAKRNNGCLECRTRRVICDKTEPECFKCRKKGIKCSGQGIECRFSPYMRKKSNVSQHDASAAGESGKATGKTTGRTTGKKSTIAVDNSPSKPLEPTGMDADATQEQSKQYLWVDSNSPAPTAAKDCASTVPNIKQEDVEERSPTNLSWPASQSEYNNPYADDEYSHDMKGERASVSQTSIGLQSNVIIPISPATNSVWPSVGEPTNALQSVPPNSRFLFDHFSKFIASKMVVLDFSGNAYRQVILPLATRDAMVGQAVSVVSAFHLSQVVPSLRMKAEMTQQRILSQLCKSALMPNPDQFFKLSTWVTILVLLVGDTITGSTNYVYLLDLLSQLSRAALSDDSLPPSIKQFVMQQTQMFELFGCPLSSEQKGLDMMQRRPDNYLSFMSYCPSTPTQQPNVASMTEAIRQACDIFQNRALKRTTSASSIASVERMRQTVIDMDASADGSHALVWPFFIAAAESSLPEHRDFFYNRLKELFSCTRFGSIPVALDTLQYIWRKADTTSWTDIVTKERQVLIM